MVIKGLFFDLYGTLLFYGDMVTGWQEWLSKLHECLHRFGCPVKRAVLADACDGFFSKPEPAMRVDGLTVYEHRLKVLFDGLGFVVPHEQIATAASESVRAWQSEIHLDPDAVPLLRAASADYSLALVSNFDHPLIVKISFCDFFKKYNILLNLGLHIFCDFRGVLSMTDWSIKNE